MIIFSTLRFLAVCLFFMAASMSGAVVVLALSRGELREAFTKDPHTIWMGLLFNTIAFLFFFIRGKEIFSEGESSDEAPASASWTPLGTVFQTTIGVRFLCYVGAYLLGLALPLCSSLGLF